MKNIISGLMKKHNVPVAGATANSTIGDDKKNVAAPVIVPQIKPIAPVAVANSSAVDAEAAKFKAEFDDLTAKIQAALDEGAAALAIAEAKTEEVAKTDIVSPNYAKMVEDVKAHQAKASAAFGRAEEMLKQANSLLPKKEEV